MVVAVVLPGYKSGCAIAEKLGARALRVSEKVFPDGEIYARIEEYEKLAGESVVVISTLYPNQLENLFKTLLLVNAARNAGALKVHVFIAYMAYSRQDKVFLPGEPVSGCVVTRALRSAGADTLVTVDVHSPRVLECFEGRSFNVMISDMLVEHALTHVTNPIVIAPDKGALERAAHAARKLGLDYDYLVKQRDRVTGEVSYTPREVSVEGRDVVVVDDIVSTGGTIAEASKFLIKSGVRRVVVAASHGLFVGNALSRISEAGVHRVVVADTLIVRHFHPLIEYVDISERVASVLREVVGFT